MGRVNAEMVRPHCCGAAWSGYDVEKMRIAGLARAIQSRLYLHTCSPKYCLQDRTDETNGQTDRQTYGQLATQKD